MTTYTFGGTALSTFGKVTLINDDFDIPPRRGEDITLPFRHGKIFVEKYFDSRSLTFGIRASTTTAAAMETLIDSLKSLTSSRSLQTLAQTREDTSVRNISAIVNKPLQMERLGLNTRFVIDFECPSPFWRASSPTAPAFAINATPKAGTVTHPGNVEELEPTITLTGPLSNTVITNSTNSWSLTYTGTIASPRVVTITVSNGQWVATTDLGANVIGNLTHSGGSSLMKFNPGNNVLSIADGTHTAGTVSFSFNAPYL
jgi:phage-related protein